jgi:hypothetical protein
MYTQFVRYNPQYFTFKRNFHNMDPAPYFLEWQTPIVREATVRPFLWRDDLKPGFYGEEFVH